MEITKQYYTRSEAAEILCVQPGSVFYIFKKLGLHTGARYHKDDVRNVLKMRKILSAPPVKIQFRVPPAIKDEIVEMVRIKVEDYKWSLMK
jgi:hypothetical protein